MRLRYEIQLWKPVWHHSQKLVYVSGSKTKKNALAAAARLLKKHASFSTRAKREDQVWSVVVMDTTTGKKTYVEAEEVIIPSVGELGYY